MKKPKLSRRERQVIRRMLQGEKQSAIADALKISRRAVESYVARAKAKFNAVSLPQLVLRIVENRSFSLPKPRKVAA